MDNVVWVWGTLEYKDECIVVLLLIQFKSTNDSCLTPPPGGGDKIIPGRVEDENHAHPRWGGGDRWTFLRWKSSPPLGGRGCPTDNANKDNPKYRVSNQSK